MEMHFYFGHYYATQAMWRAGGADWRRWYPAILDETGQTSGSAYAKKRHPMLLGRSPDLHGLRHRDGAAHFAGSASSFVDFETVTRVRPI